MKHILLILFAVLSSAMVSCIREKKTEEGNTKSGLVHINKFIENGSNLNYEIASNGIVNIFLAYDYQRESFNRAYDHWHFLLEAESGSEITMVFHNFDEIYNGKRIPFDTYIMDCITSRDGKTWQHVPVEWIEGNRMKVKVQMESDSLYVARVEPYRLSDLQNLYSQIEGEEKVKIIPIGKTVEERELRIIQIGNEDVPHRIFIRARAHAWESGGNWVVEGIIRTLLKDDVETEKYLGSYAVYILPMANMDGVARGVSRFNLNGMDLNRNLTKPANSLLAPENEAMEKWLEEMIAAGLKPDLAIDFHNDSNGPLFFSSAGESRTSYVTNMNTLESLLRKHTWFSEGTSYFGSTSFEEGLMSRYGIEALVYELNAHWIASLKKKPLSEDWMLLGEQLCLVFEEYFMEVHEE